MKMKNEIKLLLSVTVVTLLTVCNGGKYECLPGLSADGSGKLEKVFGDKEKLTTQAVTVGTDGSYIYMFSPCSNILPTKQGVHLLAVDAADGITFKKQIGVNATVNEKNGVLTLTYIHDECHSSIVITCGSTKGTQFERVDKVEGSCKASGVFVITSSEICPKTVISPVTLAPSSQSGDAAHPTAPTSVSDHHLDSGHSWFGTLVFLIVMGTIIYFIGGFAYNRLVLGATDFEQCPHFHFWMGAYRSMKEMLTNGSSGFPRTTSGIGDYAAQPVPTAPLNINAEGRFQYDQPVLGAAVNSPQRRQGNIQAGGRPEEESADEMLLPV